MVVYQLDACAIVRMVSKPKIIGCSNIRIGLGELVGAQLVTLSFSPKFRSQSGINRSCIEHIDLDTLVRGGLGNEASDNLVRLGFN